jgi:hypothetical protein
MQIQTNVIWPGSTDSGSWGISSVPFQSAYLSRSIQGSKSKALTEGAATEFVRISIANQTTVSGSLRAAVEATDGSALQEQQNFIQFSCRNLAGVESCNMSGTTDAQAVSETLSSGTLTCDYNTSSGLTDAIGFAVNCTSSLTQTSLNVKYRFDLLTPATVTPQ